MAIMATIKKALGGRVPEEEEFKKLKKTVDKIFEDTKEDRDEMNRFMKRFKGQWWDNESLKITDSRISANIFFSTVMTIAPLITDNRPIWSVRARKPYMQEHLEGFSLGLEYLWDKLEMDMVVFKWILDALIMKYGILKCYYNPDSGFYGDVAVEVVDPRNFFCAPGYEDIWDAPMCGVRIKKDLSWVRTNYPKTGKDVKPDDSGTPIHDDDPKWMHNDKWIDVYEVWLKDDTAEEYYTVEALDEKGQPKEVDKKEEGSSKAERAKYPFGRILVFTKDALLDDRPSPYKHGKPPYVAVYDYLVPHNLIGMGEGNQIEELNKSYNRNLQLLDNYTRFRCDPPLFADTNAGVDIEQLKKEIPAGGGVFAYNAMTSAKPLITGDIGNLDQAVLQSMGGISKLIEEISGVTDITKGMTTKSQRQSAMEISTLIESSYTRTRQRVRNFEFSVKRVLYLMIDTMQQFYTESRNFSLQKDNQINYYKVSNSSTQAQAQMSPQIGTGQTSEEDAQIMADYEKFIAEWGNVDEIYAEFDLEVQTNSTLPMDRQSLANLFLRLLEMAGGNPVTGMPMWEAALTALRIPRYKQIIQKMQELFDKQQQPPPGAMPGGPGPAQEGPPNMMELLQKAGGQ
jgi:hypothetical protein